MVNDMKKILFLIFMIGVVVCLSGCGAEEKQTTYNVEIVVKDMGTIKLELDAEQAPITTKNFVNLARKGFYDGLTFHRVIENFMIQGGDPNGDGTGGSTKSIKGEFGANGVDNEISHTRGTISMGRRENDYNSASSQFFIVHKDSTGLDGQYAAFGHVTDGMDVVDAIAENTPTENEDGYVAKNNQPVIESIRVIE